MHVWPFQMRIPGVNPVPWRLSLIELDVVLLARDRYFVGDEYRSPVELHNGPKYRQRSADCRKADLHGG